MTSFLRHYGEERPGFELPSRVYARVDQVEEVGPTEEGSRVALFDSVNAIWFDEVGRSRRALADPKFADETDEQVSVVEVSLNPGEVALDGARLDEEQWLQLELGRPGTGRTVSHYANLFLAPIERSLLSVSPVDAARAQELDEAAGIDEIADASASEIYETLIALPEAGAAAVYDVGQGGCNAVLDGDSFPALYFDFGGGVLGSRDSFPSALSQFCFSRQPPIVLSHWDWDHWSSASRDPRAYEWTWIVPRQGKIGFVHAAFLAQVRRQGSVLVWPTGLGAITVGDVTLIKCSGAPSQRNNSGLALVLEGESGRRRGRALFPGDARYDNVPGSGQEFTHVVVPHHGGRTRSTFVPLSDRQTCGRLVYSHGMPNTYGHPFEEVVSAHAAIWKADLRTANRDASGLGHVHLYWRDKDRNADPPCGGGSCHLTCSQR
jgi:beta-lactamase superfamily II metal-dependent hydrolase